MRSSMTARIIGFFAIALTLLFSSISFESPSKSASFSGTEIGSSRPKDSDEMIALVNTYFEFSRAGVRSEIGSVIALAPESYFLDLLRGPKERSSSKESIETSSELDTAPSAYPNLQPLRILELDSILTDRPLLIRRRHLEVDETIETVVGESEGRVRVRVKSADSRLSLTWDIFVARDSDRFWKVFRIADVFDSES